MLPFGLFTEVSAGALGVGAGPAAGPFPGLAGTPSAFAAALSASGGTAQAAGLPDGQAFSGLGLKGQKTVADGTQGLPAGLEALLLAVPAVQPPVANGVNLEGDGGGLDIDPSAIASAPAGAGGQTGAPTGAAGAGVPSEGGFAPEFPATGFGNGAPQAPAGPSTAGNGQPVPAASPAGLTGQGVSPEGASKAAGAAAAPVAAVVPDDAGGQAGAAGGEDAEGGTVPAKSVSADVRPSVNAASGGKEAAVAATQAAAVKEAVQPAGEGQRRRRWQSELPEDVRSTLLKQSLAADAADVPQAGGDPAKGADGAGPVADVLKKTAKAAGEPAAVPVSNAGKAASGAAQGAEGARQIAAAPVSGQTDGAPAVAGDAAEAVDSAAAKPVQPQTPDAKPAGADAGKAAGSPALEAAVKQVAGKAAQQDQAIPAAADEVVVDDADAVDPGEPVPASDKTVRGTAAADAADDKASAKSGTASVSAERNALTAAANPGAASQAADAEADPDGQMSFTLNMRADGTSGQIATGRADMQQTPTQAQAAHVATHVAAGIVRHLQNGQTRFQMRLDPPELGRVDVDLKVASDGRVHAHLIVERPETLDLFMRDQRGLERALQHAGLDTNAENLSFSLNDNGSQQSGFSWGDGEQGSGGEAAGPAADTVQEPDDGQTIQMAVGAQQGGLDIRI